MAMRIGPPCRTLYFMDTSYGSGSSPIWERPEPKPRAAPVALSRDRIATAAIRLADAGGLDGVSVRKIATELGTAPMRLYDYFTGKQELFDLMVDAVYAEIAAATRRPHGDWRAGVRAVAEATRAAALAHEWFADLLGGRPRLSPHSLAVGESTASALNRAPGAARRGRQSRPRGRAGRAARIGRLATAAPRRVPGPDRPRPSRLSCGGQPPS